MKGGRGVFRDGYTGRAIVAALLRESYSWDEYSGRVFREGLCRGRVFLKGKGLHWKTNTGRDVTSNPFCEASSGKVAVGELFRKGYFGKFVPGS